jgi:hypothetical protein
MTQNATASLATNHHRLDLPYARSWIDELIHWIDRIPGSSWLFYVVLLVTMAFLNNAVRWLDGSLAVGSFIPIRVLDAGYVVIFLALYNHLSLVAKRSFEVFQPVLKASDLDTLTLSHQITNLPRWLGGLAVLFGLGLAVASLQADEEAFGLDVLTSLISIAFLYAVTIFSFSCMFALLFQTIRQLRRVNDLHQRADKIDLFQLEPVHAFSSLTARTGIGLILFIVYSGLVESSNITDANLAGLVIFGVLAVFVFTLPLLGMRKRLKIEKAQLIGDVNERIKVTIGRIHDQVDSNQHEKVGELRTAMSALIEERNLIAAISTWPWDPSTLRGFASTLLLPIFLWLITSLLERLI